MTGTRGALPALLALSAAVAVGVFADGGYSPGARVAFSVTAIGAGAVAIAAAGDRAPLRLPAVGVLLGLASLGALSVLWTVGPVDRTLIWALVTAGYAAVAAAACVVASRPNGVVLLATVVAAVAVVAAAIGLGASALHESPYAERLGGEWRPGGPFEYPPALALLQVSALPALLVGAARGSTTVARLGASGLALAGGVLALSASRTGLAMAVAVVGLALVANRETVGRPRAVVAGAAGICLLAGLVAAVVGDHAGLGVRVGAVAATPLAAAGLWPAVRGALEGTGAGPRRRPAPAVVAGVLVAALAVGSLGFGWAAGHEGGFLHGRDGTWTAALETFADRPVTGAGADAFLAASVRHQDGQSIRFAHNLVLELGAELGIAGLLGALGLYAVSIQALWAARLTAAGWLLGPAVAAFLVSGLVDWPWHLAGAGAVWALALGGLVGTHISKGGRMDRPRMLAVAAVAALAIAGCGGDDGESNTALSYDDYTKQVNDLCRTVNADLKPDAEKLTGEADHDAEILDLLIPKVEDANKEFDDLEPPDELEAAADDFSEVNEAQLAGDRQAADAAHAGDQEEYDAELTELRKLDAESDDAAIALGAEDCAT